MLKAKNGKEAKFDEYVFINGKYYKIGEGQILIFNKKTGDMKLYTSKIIEKPIIHVNPTPGKVDPVTPA